jgi:hypothetical protein
MEYVADVFDFADGTHQHLNADAANGDEVREKIRWLTASSAELYCLRWRRANVGE